MDLSIVVHEAPFGPLVVLYLFLAGLSQGLFLISAAGTMGWAPLRPLARPAAAMALATFLPGMLALIFDLGKPARFFQLLLHYNFSSVMSWGTIILTLYGLLLSAYIWSLWRGGTAARRLAGLGIFLALSLGGYTGMLLAVVRDRPIWASGLLPVLFIVSGLVAGIAVITVLARWIPELVGLEKGHTAEVLHSLKLWLVGAEVALLGIHFLVLFTGSAAGQVAAQHFLIGARQFSFLWLQVGLGMVLPVILLILASVGRMGGLAILAGLLSLMGVFALRYNLVIGGGEIPLTGEVLNYAHASPAIWTTFGVLAGLAAILALVMPGLLNRLLPRA